MRCFARNAAAAMLVILFSGAAAAPAGVVAIRASAALNAQPRPAALDPPSDTWFPTVIAWEPVPVASPHVLAPPRTPAILIPLPAPAWLGIAGVACALLAAAQRRRRKPAA